MSEFDKHFNAGLAAVESYKSARHGFSRLEAAKRAGTEFRAAADSPNTNILQWIEADEIGGKWRGIANELTAIQEDFKYANW